MQKLYAFQCSNGKKYWCKPDSCLICKHMTDIFWDYTNGPYARACDIEGTIRHDPIENRLICKDFILDDNREVWEI